MSLFPKTEVERDFSKLNKLLYGFPKTGKTTWASKITDANGKPPLFIMTEEGDRALEIHRVRITHWDGFKQLIKYLEQHKVQIAAEHSCLVIDLVSDLDDMCTNWVCAQTNVTALADLDYGKGFHMQKSNFRNAVTKLFNILPVVFLAHSAEKEIMWNNEKIKVQSPNLSKGCLEFINGKVDLIMWISPANSQQQYPEIVMQNSTTCIAGSRFPQLVRNFPFDPARIEDTYKLMSDTFSGVVTQPNIKGEKNVESTELSN